MKTIIAGSRDIIDYDFVKGVIDSCPWEITEVVSGTARGVDMMGERWAKKNGIPVTRMPADWQTFGRSAGPKRNERMAVYADAVVLIWNGISRGTGNMLEHASAYGLTIHCKRYTP